MKKEFVFFGRKNSIYDILDKSPVKHTPLARVYESAGITWPLGRGYDLLLFKKNNPPGFDPNDHIIFEIVDKKKWLIFKIKHGISE
jgi:hypothetical protein